MKRVWVSRLVTLLCSLFAGGALAAQEVIELDVQEAVSRAINSNLSVRAGRLGVAGSQRQIDASWNVFLPSITVGTTLNRSNEANQIFGTQDEYRWTGTASVDARLTVLPQVFVELNAARSDHAAGILSQTELEEQISEQVQLAFYSLLLQREQVAVAEASAERSQRTVNDSRADHAAGLAPLQTLRQAELAAANAQLLVIQRQVTLEQSLADFAELLAIEPDRTIVLRGAIATPQSVASPLAFGPTRDAVAGRTDLARLQVQIEAQTAREASARIGRYLPSITVAAGYNPVIPDVFNANSAANEQIIDNGSLSVSLSFALDGLLPFSQQAVSQDGVQTRSQTLALEYQEALRSAQAEYRTLLRSLAASQAALAAGQLSLDLAREVLDLTEEAYTAGSSDFAALDDATQAVLEAELALLSERFNYQSIIIRLASATGQQVLSNDTQGVER